MRRFSPVLAALLVALPAAGARGADPLEEALAALRTAPAEKSAAAVDAVLALSPDRAAVVERLGRPFLVDSLPPGTHRLEAVDAAGNKRPFTLHVPASCDAPAPLVVYLHGGVSRPDYPPDAGGVSRMWAELADKHGFFVASPLARGDCVWWTDAGVAHIRATIREAKRRVPVDDDAIVATGFSDGGSGCYYLAMAAPWPFAAFLPHNGHPAVAATASGKQLYLRNLKLRPNYAAMTSDDQLYPAWTVLEHLQPALRDGASIRLVNYEHGGHTPVYFPDLGDAFAAFAAQTPRDALPRAFDWWCAGPAEGAAAWAEVLETGAARGDVAALEDLNVMSRPGRVRLGIYVDRAFTGPGVRVERVAEKSVASTIGMRAGDVLVALDGVPIEGLEQLAAALKKKSFDQPVDVTVRRGEVETTLAGRIPAFVSEAYYRRDQPTARLSVSVESGVVRVITRNVRRLRLWLHPDVVDPVHARFEVNGRAHEVEVERLGLREILERYAREADQSRVFAARVTLELPEPGK